MPIYEYECPKCGRFEEIQKISDPPLKLCPKCEAKGKKKRVERLLSSSAFHLKGSGWYKTDYAAGNKAGSSEPTKKETTEKKEGEKKVEAKKSEAGSTQT